MISYEQIVKNDPLSKVQFVNKCVDTFPVLREYFKNINILSYFLIINIYKLDNKIYKKKLKQNMWVIKKQLKFVLSSNIFRNNLSFG